MNNQRLVLYRMHRVVQYVYRDMPRYLLADVGMKQADIPEEAVEKKMMKPIFYFRDALLYLHSLHHGVYDFNEGRICHWSGNELIIDNASVFMSRDFENNTRYWWFGACKGNIIIENRVDFVCIKTIGYGN